MGPASKEDFDLLLLVGLVTYQLARVPMGSIDLQSLYLTVKSLFLQVQAFSVPSLHLIYAHHNPDFALITLTSCARIAYAAGLDGAELAD